MPDTNHLRLKHVLGESPGSSFLHSALFHGHSYATKIFNFSVLNYWLEINEVTKRNANILITRKV